MGETGKGAGSAFEEVSHEGISKHLKLSLVVEIY